MGAETWVTRYFARATGELLLAATGVNLEEYRWPDTPKTNP